MARPHTVCGTEGEMLQSLWDDAFDVYKDRTGVDLRYENSDFALRLRGCDSMASVLGTLHDTASRFSGYREGSPKWSKFRQKLEPVITVIALFIDAAAEGAASVSVPGGKAVFVAFGVLLKATQGVSEKFDALIDLLESLELFFRQLSIRSDVPLGKESRSIVVEILVEMLKALALATQMMKQNRIKHFVRELFKGDDMKAILDRLQKLTTIESRMTVVEILGMVNQAGDVLGDVNRATSSLRRQNLDILEHLSMLPANLEQQVASIMEKSMQRISEEISVSITQKHASTSSVGPRLETTPTHLLPSNIYLDLFYRMIRALITVSGSEQAMIRRDMAALLPVVTTTRLTAMEGSSWALSSLAAAIDPTTAISLYTQTIVLYIVAYTMWRLISKVTSAIPSTPDFDIRNTIVLIDLVGVEVRLPLECCTTFEDFHCLLTERFSKQRKNVAKYVLSRAYEVTDMNNSAILYPHAWERRIRAGMKLDMAALLRRPFVACPWCGLENKAALWIYCECGRTYQASAASLTESQEAFIQELEPEGSSSVSDDMTTNPGLKDEGKVEIDSYTDMALLRKVHVIFDDSDPSPSIPGFFTSTDVAPGQVTYTTSLDADGQPVYHPFKAVAATYQTPTGIVSGIQWVPGESTWVYPTDARPANVEFAAAWSRWPLSKEEQKAVKDWQREEEKRRRREEKKPQRHREMEQKWYYRAPGSPLDSSDSDSD
ncbi:hypothetical protein MSAN_01756500 [Mycena sanguinolenta]|uniref:Fungal STAND N-terminal Goodbye domain-containing protein n=1 Tax=Mycena sanguinolenta TaxID=230812 RepID=A0A8H7CU22_9AGAR|nr:hypothetical protein MSAN_01756500 [Mycena sanguinolenta]